MEEFERKLKRAGFRCRRDRRRADAPPADPQKKERSANGVRKKIKALQIEQGICSAMAAPTSPHSNSITSRAASTLTSVGHSAHHVTRRKLSWDISIHRPPPTRTMCST